MIVNNIHERLVLNPIRDPAYLVDSFSDKEAPLWPSKLWPRESFDRPLQIGAIGAHGGSHYEVSAYEPGKNITFRFIYPKGYKGLHGFIVNQIDSHTVSIKHFVNLELYGLDAVIWTYVIRWVHDALIENAIDSAEIYLTNNLKIKSKWKIRVYVLRHILGCWRLVVNYLRSLFFRIENSH